MVGKKQRMHLADMRYNGMFGRHSYCGRYVGPAGMVETFEEFLSYSPHICRVCLTRKEEHDTKVERLSRRLGLEI